MYLSNLDTGPIPLFLVQGYPKRAADGNSYLVNRGGAG
jgi:hypothetical protein